MVYDFYLSICSDLYEMVIAYGVPWLIYSFCSCFFKNSRRLWRAERKWHVALILCPDLVHTRWVWPLVWPWFPELLINCFADVLPSVLFIYNKYLTVLCFYISLHMFMYICCIYTLSIINNSQKARNKPFHILLLKC